MIQLEKWREASRIHEYSRNMFVWKVGWYSTQGTFKLLYRLGAGGGGLHAWIWTVEKVTKKNIYNFSSKK